MNSGGSGVYMVLNNVTYVTVTMVGGGGAGHKSNV
jgi:hypothetical protein